MSLVARGLNGFKNLVPDLVISDHTGNRSSKTFSAADETASLSGDSAVL